MIKTTPLLLLFIVTQTQFLCAGAHHYHGSPHTQDAHNRLPSATEKKFLARIARLKREETELKKHNAAVATHIKNLRTKLKNSVH